MNQQTYTTSEKQIKYSVFLSTLFCSGAVLMLTVLNLINNKSLDINGLICLLKLITPAGACFWLIGAFIGTILDNSNDKALKKRAINIKKAYEIPSIFMTDNENEENDGMEI